MRLTRFLFGMTLFCVAADPQSASPSESPFAGIDDSIASLSRMTGLRPLKKVQYDTIDRTRLKTYLDQKVKEELKVEDIEAEELTLKKFGLVPKDFNLRSTMVDLLAEQAAAFYDYREKKLYLLQGSDPATQGAFIFHELAHALADQHFNLGRYVRKGSNDDSSLARLAVLEGQATWLMFEFMAQKMGQSLKTAPAVVDMLSRSTADQFSSQYPVLSNAPLYIRASLLFPYMDGLRFQNALVSKLDKEGFARPFKDPPVSSQQILHPEKYLAGIKPSKPNLPKMATAKEWMSIAEGSVGEFDHAVLIEQYGNKEDALKLAPQLRGSSFALLKNKADGRTVLLYSSEWEGVESARQMFASYRRVLERKWTRPVFRAATETNLEGTGDDGEFRVTLNGTQVISVEGLKSAADVKTGSDFK